MHKALTAHASQSFKTESLLALPGTGILPGRASFFLVPTARSMRQAVGRRENALRDVIKLAVELVSWLPGLILGLLARTLSLPTKREPAVYVWDHCPHCIHVRAVLGLGKVDHRVVQIMQETLQASSCWP